jgi:hypothetical protein
VGFEKSARRGEVGAFDEDEVGVKLCGGLAEGSESVLGLKAPSGVFCEWLPRWIEIG